MKIYKNLNLNILKMIKTVQNQLILRKKTHHLEKHKTEIDMFFSNKRKHKGFIKNNKLIVKTQKNLKQDLEVKGIMFLLKKLIRLLYVQMMIKE